MNNDSPKIATIKNIYLYLVSFIALMMIVFSTADLINTLLRSYVFPRADQPYYEPYPACIGPPCSSDKIDGVECAAREARSREQAERSRVANRERNLIRDISFIVVATPLFLFHWRMVRRKEESLT